MKSAYWSVGLLTLVAACSSGTSPNLLTQNRDGNSVTGRFGSNWSAEEIGRSGLGAVCEPSEATENLVVTLLPDGSGTFSATCTS